MANRLTFLVKIWHRSKRIIIAGLSILIFVLIGLGLFLHFVKGYGWAEWTGFVGYTITKVDPLTNNPVEVQVQSRYLWDWLELLIIPLALAFGALWFNKSERQNEIRIAEERTKSEREIASDRMKEGVLQSYIDRMTELMLEKDLRNSSQGDEVRVIARTRTLTSLRILDSERQGLLIRFLNESGLIIHGRFQIVDLSQADLTGIKLNDAKLRKIGLIDINLTGANLIGADLNGAGMERVDLSKARMKGVKLGWADLSDTCFREANLESVDFSEFDEDRFMTEGIGADTENEMKFPRTRLNRPDFTGAILKNANLRKIYMTCPILKGADLSNCNFTGAHLEDVDFTDANLTGANLTGLKIRELRRGDTKMSGIILTDATMPDGSKFDPNVHKLSDFIVYSK